MTLKLKQEAQWKYLQKGNLWKFELYKMIKGEEHSPYLTLCKQVLELDNNPPYFVRKLKDI